MLGLHGQPEIQKSSTQQTFDTSRPSRISGNAMLQITSLTSQHH